MEVKNSVLGVQGLKIKVERLKSASPEAGEALVPRSGSQPKGSKGSDDFISKEGASPLLPPISDQPVCPGWVFLDYSFITTWRHKSLEKERCD